jgi:uncharacterized membrane protein YdjX (TVP38/TMEM64 family)
VYVVATALSFPGALVLTLAAGALFGLVVGTVIVSFASSIGATLAFLASRYLLRDAVQAALATASKPSTKVWKKTVRCTCSPCGWCPCSRFFW